MSKKGGNTRKLSIVDCTKVRRPVTSNEAMKGCVRNFLGNYPLLFAQTNKSLAKDASPPSGDEARVKNCKIVWEHF